MELHELRLRQLDAFREENDRQYREIQKLQDEVKRLKVELKEERRKKFRKSADNAKLDGQAKPNKGQQKKKAKRGAPVGHPGWFRRMTKQPDHVVAVAAPTTCPDCGHAVKRYPKRKPSRHHQDDIMDGRKQTICFVHPQSRCTNPKCRRWVQKAGPGELLRSKIGPNARAKAPVSTSSRDPVDGQVSTTTSSTMNRKTSSGTILLEEVSQIADQVRRRHESDQIFLVVHDRHGMNASIREGVGRIPDRRLERERPKILRHEPLDRKLVIEIGVHRTLVTVHALDADAEDVRGGDQADQLLARDDRHVVEAVLREELSHVTHALPEMSGDDLAGQDLVDRFVLLHGFLFDGLEIGSAK